MRVFLSFFLSFITCSLIAQTNSNIPMGAWRTHLPNNSVTTVSIHNNKVYAGSSISTSTFDISDNHLEALSKNNGLSESDVSIFRFNEAANYGLIGYASGNIDAIKNGAIYNFDVILRATIAESKHINNITLYDKMAFISCDYGVSIINIEKFEVSESWINLNVNGLSNKVYACVLNAAQDSVFLATEFGVMSAPYDRPGINLMDFKNWHVYSNISATHAQSVGELNGRIYAGMSGIGVFVLNGSTWQNIGLPIDTSTSCWNLVPSKNKLLLSADSKVFVIDSPSSYSSVLTQNKLTDIHDATYDNWGNLWLADSTQGLVRFDGANYSFYNLNGPYNISAFNLYYYNNTMLANSGGYSSTYSKQYLAHGFYEFQNQDKWANYNRFSSSYPYNISDDITAFYNPYDNTLYIGQFGSGFVTFKKPDTFIHYDTTNCPIAGNSATGFDVDSKGNLWIATFGAPLFQSSLFSKSKEGTWIPYTLNTSIDQNRSLLQLKIDSYGNKWMRYGNNGMGKGVMVFNESTYQERYFDASILSSGNVIISDSPMPGSKINCIEIDKKGVVWIGSDQGIAGFYEPSEAFTGSFVKPIYNGFGVLFDKNITCIKTDGGNRKWVGTTEGLWLFDENFTSSIFYFTAANSPLYSDYIISVDIHALTGEVFIATDKGIISFRSNATDDNADFSGAKIFPNPVKPDYNGFITIEGLQNNVIVKITDMQGKIFYEARSNGGTATWNMVNYAGIKAETGMYLVFATTDKGEQKFVGKIAIVQ